MALLEVKNLSVSFRNEENKIVEAVKDVSFSIASGEVVGIVGESRFGKIGYGFVCVGVVALS